MNMPDFANRILAGPPRCSWCDKEMNLAPQPGTHTICARHKLQLEAERARLLNIYAVEDAMGKEPRT